MTTEQKAKAYDVALAQGKQLKRANPYDTVSDMIDSIFPELKESDDERVRKELLSFIQNWKNPENIYGDTKSRPMFTKNENQCDRYISWLEKHKYTEEDMDKAYKCADEVQYKRGYEAAMREIKKQSENNNSPKFTFDDVFALQRFMEKTKKEKKDEELYKQLQSLYNKVHIAYYLEKQSERKSKNKSDSEAINEKKVDKVEPKFKVGDFVVHEMDNGSKVVRKIVDMTNKSYILDGEDFNCFYFKDLETDYHLWSIQDAKDGDVLVREYNPFIFRKTMEDDDAIWIDAYCGVNIDGDFTVNDEDECWCTITECFPATKEQSDLLFSKMQEAGYKWDAEKKELKKIEQKPVNCKSIDKLAEIIKDEFDGFRNLLKKEGIDYEPQQTYWNDFARLFVSLAKEYFEQKSVEGTFINVDDVREDFMNDVYRILDADSTNDRANQIIDAFDSLPYTVVNQKPAEWSEEDNAYHLEKQGEQKPNDESEQEKRDFVGDGFVKCRADYQDFKEGEHYWLEYVGNDNYNVRSDNLLGKTYHITPLHLYTVFAKLGWLSKAKLKEAMFDCQTCANYNNECYPNGNRFKCDYDKLTMETRYCIEYINPCHPLLDNGNINVRYDRVLTLEQAEHDITMILSFGGKIVDLYMGNVINGKTGEWNPGPMIVDSEDWYSEDWLKSIKDRVIPQPKVEWSEGDEAILNTIIKAYRGDLVPTLNSITRKICLDWLKSLRPHSIPNLDET